MKKITCVFQLLMVFVLVGACTTARTSDVAMGNPAESIRQLEENLTDARSRNIDVLSPEFYEAAEASLAQAKQALQREAKLSTIQKYVMAIKSNALGNARKMMADAKKDKLFKNVPLAYGAAENALQEAEVYAEQNPYDAEQISQKNLHAEFMARRLNSVSESSENFKGLDPEAAALYLEDLLARLGTSLKTGDISDKGVNEQLSALTGAVAAMEKENLTLASENNQYREQVSELQQRLSGVQDYSQEQEAAARKLAAERQFNQQFDTVQGYFLPAEAEVYKQGGKLVIRLRGIKFPVGQATLTPENYTLLSKVQKAIGTFDQPNVTIEGHTDSTGSAEKNQALSQKRADAVKTYLVANKTLPENNIQAVGFGPDRPLAPNTTPEGRATNRRIDVVISPTQSPEA
jgi:outer membrane protein OmpA-like peptidoglycan-associated protein